MNVGLLLRGLGVLPVQPQAPEEHLPSGVDMQRHFDTVTVSEAN